MGNGAVFQLVPQHFRKEIGMVTGIVGAAGGIGGFFLPNILGSLKQMTGSYASGFISHVSHCLRLCLFWQQVIVGEAAMALKAALRMFKFERKTRVTACLFHDV
ncbi:Nitrate transporter [Bacillus amyloliquefaciens]|nr:Nitrate transporter [Bacillus amyloliquefaciens]